MKLGWIATCLALIGVTAIAPLRAGGETDNSSRGAMVAFLPLPPEDDPAEPLASGRKEQISTDGDSLEEPITERPAANSEIPSHAGTSPPTEFSQTRLGENPHFTASPVPEKKSWWRSILGWIGLDNDTGETVQSAANFVEQSTDYIIGPGDQIGISVWRDENLSRMVVVLHDGKIYFPLIGEMTAGGKTVAQLKKELEERLSRYVSDTKLTVEIKQSNSMIIYIVGKVNSPGRQILLANTNVLQAIAMVGGLNLFADGSDIKIFRKEAGKTVMYPFNYDDVAKGRHLETNIELKRGDVIIVP